MRFCLVLLCYKCVPWVTWIWRCFGLGMYIDVLTRMKQQWYKQSSRLQWWKQTWGKKRTPNVKSRKTQTVPVCFLACAQKKKFNEWRTTAEPAQILCNHQTGGDPIASVNCSLLRIHTPTHTNGVIYTLENITFTPTSACLVVLH